MKFEKDASHYVFSMCITADPLKPLWAPSVPSSHNFIYINFVIYCV